MGRYRRGHRNNRRGHNRKQNKGNEDSSSSPPWNQMTEADWSLLEKYLLDYRSTALEVYRSKQARGRAREGGQPSQGRWIDGHLRTTVEVEANVVIGSHRFLPLTREVCERPYIDLPDTLGSKERRRIHSLCSNHDLYHTGAGDDDDDANVNDKAAAANDSNGSNGIANLTRKRRIVMSIYADGLEFVADLPSHRGGESKSFPSRRCQPWYYHAHASTNSDNQNNPYEQRIRCLESEKQQIRQFVNLPEQSLRTSSDEVDRVERSFSDSIDLNELESFDLSMVPTPEETPWMLVDTVEKLKLCAEELLYGVGAIGDESVGSPKIPKIRELAFDLEMHNILDTHSRQENKTGIRTCLLQLTSDVGMPVAGGQSGGCVSKLVYKDYIVDPLAPGLWDAIPVHLGPLFSDPKIVKIGHGIGGMDTSSLHRDFGMLVVNAFDTYEASTILSPRKGGMGLATLCRHYKLPKWEHYKALKHKYQNSDWKRRPLDDDALAYGRYDIRYLVALRKLLLRDLVKLDMIGRCVRFGSSVEDDSDFDSAPTPPTSKGGTPLSSTLSSFSENEVVDTEASDLDQFNDARMSKGKNPLSRMASLFSDNEVDDANASDLDRFNDARDDLNGAIAETEEAFADSIGNSGTPSLLSSSAGSIIHASEFPCHHHLMKAISTSQKRCLKLWTGDGEEPILKNPSLISMIKQAANQKGHGKHWTDTNMKLYQSLFAWRRASAQKEKVHASEVCSLDFLVYVAYKLPSSRWAMRRYSYALPMLLEDENLPYCDELCEMVLSSDAFQQRATCSASDLITMDVVFYSSEDVGKNVWERHGGMSKFLVASAVVGAIVFTMSRVRMK
eukprot:CAMPEP_0172573150 /NCGR_PEP_ID=MMETSP1067-20121228/136042_1 /TAXON_ID=265564 ORGANISM="Thalassiosira punctigera, Strain Tpunct2005C2" /NCGR_SAMPLE_ID=MMETSP1067 /ASSEMBLY_ACC=CAM_ASM_000444 /LENGTH=842 /DNA_ID=CAMNT_0013365747 /DNA_START=32 /DNA_END=2560 /DNA_ORIENTATION=+